MFTIQGVNLVVYPRFHTHLISQVILLSNSSPTSILPHCWRLWPWDPPWLTAVDLNLSITCQIKERFRTLPLLRSSLQSPPSQLQFPGRRTSSGPPNEVIPRTHDWGKLPRCCCFYHRRCRHGLTLLANVSHPPTPLSLPMWKQQVVMCIRSLPERVCL